MTVLPIIVAPDPRLKIKAKPVDAVDDDVRQLMDDMLDSMYAAQGIGLAAPQVGVSDDDREHEEGCLSLPEYYAAVVRPDHVRIRYLDRDNEIREIDTDGLLATCIQHEIDHLDGVLFVDHVSALKRNMILRKLQKAKKLAAQPA